MNIAGKLVNPIVQWKPQSLNAFSLRPYALDERVWAGFTRKLTAARDALGGYTLSENSFRDCGILCSQVVYIYVCKQSKVGRHVGTSITF